MANRLTRYDESPMPGAYYRIRLMLSPQFIGMFGDPKTQLHVSVAVTERLSVRNSEMAKLVKDVGPQTSEEEAQKLFKVVADRYRKIVNDAELELKNYITPTEYEKIVLVQLGLLGPGGLADEAARKLLKINDDQLEAMQPQLKELRLLAQTSVRTGDEVAARTAATRRASAEKAILKALNTTQENVYKQACEQAKVFRQKEAERIESTRDELSFELIGNNPSEADPK